MYVIFKRAKDSSSDDIETEHKMGQAIHISLNMAGRIRKYLKLNFENVLTKF